VRVDRKLDPDLGLRLDLVPAVIGDRLPSQLDVKATSAM
jgi:hypothetical protein